jgi:hypothetical protein
VTRLSKKALEARRANAKKSTGPKTERGKRSVSMNAFRHGLSLSFSRHSEGRDQIDRLASIILRDYCSRDPSKVPLSAGDANPQDDIITPSMRHAAFAFAEAHFDLERVRSARIEVLEGDIVTLKKLSAAEQKRALLISQYMSTPENAAETVVLASKPREVVSSPPIPKKYAILASTLFKMERYEKRALSRRNKALRRLEDFSQDLALVVFESKR